MTQRCLADRRRVEQTALAPKLVQAASEMKRRFLADITLEALAVVTDLLDDLVRPIWIDLELLAHIAFDPEHPANFRVRALCLDLVHVLGSDAELLGNDHGVQRPANDIAPLVIAMTYQWPERLLGDDFRQ